MEVEIPQLDKTSKDTITDWNTRMMDLQSVVHKELTAVLDAHSDLDGLEGALDTALWPYNANELEQLETEVDDDALVIYHNYGEDGVAVVRLEQRWWFQSAERGDPQSADTQHAEVARAIMDCIFWGRASWVTALTQDALDELGEA